MILCMHDCSVDSASVTLVHSVSATVRPPIRERSNMWYDNVHNNYETPFYVRTRHGQTGNVDTLEEALAIFAGEDGYRLNFMIEGAPEIVIYRSEQPDEVDLTSAIYGARYSAIVNVRDCLQNIPAKPELKVVE